VSERTREYAITWPEGVAEAVVVDGVPYLADFGPVDKSIVMGWYFGYPPCCVRSYVRSRDERIAAEGVLGFDGPSPSHPVSGHLLCPACAAGEPAPLPDRPAARYGWVWIDPDDDVPVFTAPSDYDYAFRASTPTAEDGKR